MTDSGLKTRHEIGYIAFRIGLGLGSRLPLGLTRPICRQLGVFALAIATRDRRRARAHLRIAFPDLSEPQIRRLLHSFARHIGSIAAEVAWLWRASPQQVMALCTMDGTEHFRDALDLGRGVIMVTAHCGPWEVANARLCAAGLPMVAAVRSIDDPRLDQIAGSLRSRFGTEIVPRGVDAGRLLTAALNRNRVIGLLIDQDIRDVPSVFVPFFGRQAWTPSGAAALAIRHRCPIVPAFIHRHDDHTCHMEVHPPLQIPEHGRLRDKVTELTANSTALIERQIRAYPEQWVWMHRRWRTQPPPDQERSGEVEK